MKTPFERAFLALVAGFVGFLLFVPVASSASASSAEKRVLAVEFEQDVNPFVEQAFEHATFFTRLHHFVLVSDAYIVAPGGLGTLLETMMIWQLLQARHLHDTPLIFAGPMWRGLVEWASAMMLRPGFELASPQDMQIPCCVDNAAEAVAIVRDHHARWLTAQGKSS